MMISIEFLSILGIIIVFVYYSIYKKYSHRKLLKEVKKLEQEGKLYPPEDNFNVFNEKN